MGLRRYLLGSMLCVLVLTALGCGPRYVAVPPPPPPNAPPPVVQLAERNGYETGRGDGERAAVEGRPPDPRRTRAYAETPGYDRRLGPFEVYRNAFRDAYLRGYERGFRRER